MRRTAGTCVRRLYGVLWLLVISLAACLAGFVGAWFFVSWASRRAMEPLADNMRRQKRFITGGTIRVNGPSAFDADGAVTFTGGSVYVNGEQVTTISTQMMGRGGKMGGKHW